MLLPDILARLASADDIRELEVTSRSVSAHVGSGATLVFTAPARLFPSMSGRCSSLSAAVALGIAGMLCSMAVANATRAASVSRAGMVAAPFSETSMQLTFGREDRGGRAAATA